MATFLAAKHACSLSREAGISAIGIQRTSHFGPAGAYALAIAEQGLIGIVMCNSDSFVRLHDGAERFHGTNPIAVAAPSKSGSPWLLDMATSAISYNRVQLYKSLGVKLPNGAASDKLGCDTNEPDQAEMLAPLGSDFGFKGAGLAGMIEIFSALLTGMKTSAEILPMSGPDLSTPRNMGAFVICVDPESFVGQAAFLAGMDSYLSTLRNSAVRSGSRVMAPGTREWEEAARRREVGIPLDPSTAEAFIDLANLANSPPPFN